MLNYSVKLAIDKKSVRSFDSDGRLHVAYTPISKANVCPYLGHEIPNSEQLGLEPDKIYQLLRHPDEIAKAAPTFNGIQVLRKHIPVSANDPQQWDVVGCTGTDAEFKPPYLFNSLTVWVKDAIDEIESEQKRELSSAYRYTADMTPGKYKGVPYDGIMRDIVGNHVALVEEGRAGNDVMVGDAKPPQMRGLFNMSRTQTLTRKAAMTMGALAAYLRPKLAKDTQLDWGKILGSVNSKNFAQKKPAIIAGLKEQTRGKLARDASLDDVTSLLDHLDKADTEGAAHDDPIQTDPNTGVPNYGEINRLDEAHDVDAHAALREFLQGKLSPEDIEKACATVGDDDLDVTDHEDDGAMAGLDEEPSGYGQGGKPDANKMAAAKDRAARDEPPPFKGSPKVGGEMVSKDEMNRAIQFAVQQVQEAANSTAAVAIRTAKEEAARIHEAEKFVRPWVGDLAMAHDSADQVYKTALQALGKSVDGVHPSAYRAILELTPVPGRDVRLNSKLSMDSAGRSDFEKRFPEAARIRAI